MLLTSSEVYLSSAMRLTRRCYPPAIMKIPSCFLEIFEEVSGAIFSFAY